MARLAPPEAVPRTTGDAAGVALAVLRARLARDDGLPEPEAIGLLAAARERADALAPSERTAWLQVLRRFVARRASLPDALRVALVALAARWADWPLVRGLAMRPGGGGACLAEVEPALATALLRLGDVEEALALCRSRMLRHPRDAQAARDHAWLAAWRRFVGAQGGAIDDGALRLEPLGHHHMEDFAWQYHDPSIARLCCLPAFDTDARWHAWLDECWNFGDQRLYAVIDPDWGFVGSVSLIQHGALGFFYYWIGPDFQRCGRGPAAVRSLLRHAESRRGMRSCYAKVFVDNLPSRRAMEKLGFVPTAAVPASPWREEMFYLRGAPIPHAAQAEELQWLFERMGSDVRVRRPLAGVEDDARAPGGEARLASAEWGRRASAAAERIAAPA